MGGRSFFTPRRDPGAGDEAAIGASQDSSARPGQMGYNERGQIGGLAARRGPLPIPYGHGEFPRSVGLCHSFNPP